jgi:TIR domain
VPRIFISYRREDTSGYAGRLFDRLSAQYGKERVFIDIDSIEPGVDFTEVIEQTVTSCDVTIVVIGKQWLDARDSEGKRRLDNPEDFVRLEVAAALSRKIRVIPLLVGNARMPRSDDLPEALRDLARRNAFEVSDTGFHENIGRLIKVLDRLDQAGQPQAVPAPARAPSPQPVPTPRQTIDAALGIKAGPAPTRGRLSLGKAILLHLLFGFGLSYVKPTAKRRFFYPLLYAYAVFDVAMAANGVEPFDRGFGAVTFYTALVLLLLGFIDVIATCNSLNRAAGH